MKTGKLLVLALCTLVVLAGCGGGLRVRGSRIVNENGFKKLVSVTLHNTSKDFSATNIRIKVYDRALAVTDKKVSEDGKFKTSVTVQAAPVLLVPLPGASILPGEKKRCLLPEGGRRFKARKPLVKVASYDKR